jgi:hypothetical protein
MGVHRRSGCRRKHPVVHSRTGVLSRYGGSDRGGWTSGPLKQFHVEHIDRTISNVMNTVRVLHSATFCQTRWERGNDGADQQYNPQRDIKGEP